LLALISEIQTLVIGLNVPKGIKIPRKLLNFFHLILGASVLGITSTILDASPQCSSSS